MDKLRNRIKYYLLGLGIGCIFMWMIFGNRGCAWLPENRVKNMIAEKELIVGDSIKFLMECEGLTNSDVYRLLNEDGDVDFSLSKTDIVDGQPKEYHIAGVKDGKDFSIRYLLGDSLCDFIGDSLVEIIDFEYQNNNCKTAISNEDKSTIKLPLEEVITLIEAKEFRILERAACQIDCYQLSEKEILNFHRGVKVYVKESKPRLEPNPYYQLQGFIENDEFSVTYIIGENRTRIADILSASDSCLCD